MRIRVGRYRASVYREGGAWTGAVSLGRMPDGRRRRLKRKAATAEEVRVKLRQAVRDLDRGLRGARSYRVEHAVNDFLTGLAALGRADSTLAAYRTLVDVHLIPQLGKSRLVDLTADEVEEWLHGRARKLAPATLRTVHSLLKRAVRRAQRHDKVTRNVAALVDTPLGRRPGRPSRSLTFDQACALLSAAIHGGHRLGPYVVVGMVTGLRTEELRALRWEDVDLIARTVVVVRADRIGTDTKTPASRRGLHLPHLAIHAFEAARARQAADKLAAGAGFRDHGLVFCRDDGAPYSAEHVRNGFKKITARAGLDPRWCPRELRHTFISVLSDNDVAPDKLAALAGHSSVHTTLTVYRHQIRPVIRGGTEHMDLLFTDKIRPAISAH
jgi:integrase